MLAPGGVSCEARTKPGESVQSKRARPVGAKETPHKTNIRPDSLKFDQRKEQGPSGPSTIRARRSGLQARTPRNRHSAQCKQHRKALERVACLGRLDGQQQRASQQYVSEHRTPQPRPQAKPGDSQDQIQRIQSRVAPAELRLPAMVRIDPPIQIDIQVLHARAQPHISCAAQRQPKIRSQWIGVDALLGQPSKTSVDRGRKLHAVAVVVRGQCGCLGVLRGRVERAARQFLYLQLVPRHIPVNLVRRNVVQAPALNPAFPSWVRALTGIGSQPRRQRLKNMKDPPVARRPNGKWRECQQNANRRHARRAALPKLQSYPNLRSDSFS